MTATLPLTLGTSLTLLGLVSLIAWFLKPAIRWALFGNLSTLGLGLLAWSQVAFSGRPLQTTAHIAAILGVLWSAVVWLLRRRFGEAGRLRATHPGILVGQFLCLAACIYVVLIVAYFVLGQFAMSAVHTWTYTVVQPRRQLIADASGLFDLLAVGVACLITTHTTRSATLIVPLMWLAFLALAWKCLMIPPVIAETDGLALDVTGSSSLWLLTLLLGTAVLLSGTVAVQGLSWRVSRRLAWQQDVTYLSRAPRTWPGLPTSVAVLGFLVLCVLCAMLVFPAPAGAFRASATSLCCSVAALLSAIAVFAVANRHWSVGLGEIGAGLLSLSLCSAMLIFVPGQPAALYERFPILFNALVLGCAVSLLFWVWLAGVWEQQLYPDGRAWTTAGRLVPVAKRCGFVAGAFGVTFAMQMALWPALDEMPHFDNSLGRVLWSYAAMLLLGSGAVLGYVRTRHPAFRLLIMLTAVVMVFFGIVRLLPFTTLSY